VVLCRTGGAWHGGASSISPAVIKSAGPESAQKPWQSLKFAGGTMDKKPPNLRLIFRHTSGILRISQLAT
jgi:hypothetical protein